MVVSPTAAYRCLKLETFRLSKFAQWETTFQVLTILGTLPGIAARPEASATKLRFEFKHPEKGWVKVSKAALPFQASPAGVTLDFDSSRPGRIIAWDEGVVSSVIYTGSIKYVSDIE